MYPTQLALKDTHNVNKEQKLGFDVNVDIDQEVESLIETQKGKTVMGNAMRINLERRVVRILKIIDHLTGVISILFLLVFLFRYHLYTESGYTYYVLTTRQPTTVVWLVITAVVCSNLVITLAYLLLNWTAKGSYIQFTNTLDRLRILSQDSLLPTGDYRVSIGLFGIKKKLVDCAERICLLEQEIKSSTSAITLDYLTQTRNNYSKHLDLLLSITKEYLGLSIERERVFSFIVEETKPFDLAYFRFDNEPIIITVNKAGSTAV